jgi:hypothetical protein
MTVIFKVLTGIIVVVFQEDWISFGFSISQAHVEFKEKILKSTHGGLGEVCVSENQD